jgi:hypothetical protein
VELRERWDDLLEEDTGLQRSYGVPNLDAASVARIEDEDTWQSPTDLTLCRGGARFDTRPISSSGPSQRPKRADGAEVTSERRPDLPRWMTADDALGDVMEIGRLDRTTMRMLGR